MGTETGNSKGSSENEQERGGWQPLFPIGQPLLMIGAIEILEEASQQPKELLRELLYRHVTGDWGDLPEEDKERNDTAVEQGLEITSAYVLETGATIWVLTSANRVQTTIMPMELVSPHG